MITYDAKQKIVEYQGKSIHIGKSPARDKVMRMIMSRPNRSVSISDMIKNIYGVRRNRVSARLWDSYRGSVTRALYRLRQDLVGEFGGKFIVYHWPSHRWYLQPEYIKELK